jgi:hypothetical protein
MGHQRSEEETWAPLALRLAHLGAQHLGVHTCDEPRVSHGWA